MHTQLAAGLLLLFAVSCATAETDTGGFAGGAGGAAATGGAATGGDAGSSSGGSAGGSGSAGSGAWAGTGGSGGTSNCTPPVSGTCDTFPQCGCPSGQRCTVTNVDGSTACTSNGPIAPYNACNSPTDCGPGTECVGGACKPFCETNADCPGTLRDCLQVSYTPTGSSTSTPIPGFLVCSAGCQPEAPGTVCGPNLGCYPFDDPVTSTDCVAAGSGTGTGGCCTNAACSGQDITLCAPGYVCLLSGDCLKWCRIGFSDCPSGQCAPFTTPLYVGTTEYGACP
jgi:hypothetical protein